MTRIRLTWGSAKKTDDGQQKLETELLLGHVDDVYRAVSNSKPNGPVLCNTYQGLCDKQWQDLIATSDTKHRYCLSCANSVHLVKTFKQLTSLRKSGLCVAYGGKRPLDKRLVESSSP
jgi:hypothetical protein